MEWFIILQKIISSSFIIVMCIFLAGWSVPAIFSFRNLHKRYGKYVYWAGLDNYWALFAPQPVSENYLLSFELEFADGTICPWQLPEYTLQNGYQTAPHFRFIKMHNQLLSQKDPIPKAALCKYILNNFIKTNATNKLPVQIHIIRYYESSKMLSFMQIPWLTQRVFTYEVTA